MHRDLPLIHSAVYRERGPPAATMDTPATSRKRSVSSSLNTEARQPTAQRREHLSASRSTLAPHSPPSLKLLHSQVQGLRGRMAAQQQSQHPQSRSTFLDRGRA